MSNIRVTLHSNMMLDSYPVEYGRIRIPITPLFNITNYDTTNYNYNYNTIDTSYPSVDLRLSHPSLSSENTFIGSQALTAGSGGTAMSYTQNMFDGSENTFIGHQALISGNGGTAMGWRNNWNPSASNEDMFGNRTVEDIESLFNLLNILGQEHNQPSVNPT